jgi:Domain of unknown function (DUF397)
MSAARPPYAALRWATYRKSSRSSGAQECIMIGTADGWIGVQDSTEYLTRATGQRTTLGFTLAKFAAFVHSVKNGKFDHLI